MCYREALQSFSPLLVEWLLVSGRQVHWGRHREGSVPAVDLERPRLLGPCAGLAPGQTERGRGGGPQELPLPKPHFPSWGLLTESFPLATLLAP